VIRWTFRHRELLGRKSRYVHALCAHSLNVGDSDEAQDRAKVTVIQSQLIDERRQVSKPYLISRFGDVRLSNLNPFEIQVYLNQLAEKYSKSVVHRAFTNAPAIMHLARKQKYVVEDPAEDTVLPRTMPVEKPPMSREGLSY